MSLTICIFAKPPRPGHVKTRLAATVGPRDAAAFAHAFLRDTWNAVSSWSWARPVLATTDPSCADFVGHTIGHTIEQTIGHTTGHTIWQTRYAEIWLQGEGDLGERIDRIMRRGLAETDSVIAIGSDTPGLPLRFVLHAREALRRVDAVLGPSDDGGFYLIGLRRCPQGLFDNLPWSETTTFASMRRRLETYGMTVDFLEPWFDVDRPEDLVRLRSLLSRGEIEAPETARTLAACDRGRDPNLHENVSPSCT